MFLKTRLVTSAKARKLGWILYRLAFRRV